MKAFIFYYLLGYGAGIGLMAPLQAREQLTQNRAGESFRSELEVRSAVQALLAGDLTVDRAVRIGLLNNPALHETLDEVGLSQANLIQAGLLANPTLNIQARLPNKSPSGTDIESSLAADFLDILMKPLRQEVARDALAATMLQISDESLRLVADIKSAYYSVQASQQLAKRLKLIFELNSAGLELAQRQFQAGNIRDLDLAEQQDLYSQARLEVAEAEEQTRKNREKLDRLLGLWGDDTTWRITGNLPAVPSSEIPLEGLERLAISQRLDLQAAYKQVESSARALGLTKDFRYLGSLQFGVDSERESDGSTITGPTFSLDLPIFDQGQGRIAKSEAELSRAEHRLERMAINIRSEVRELQGELASAQQTARFYQNEILPNRIKILNAIQLQYNAMLVGSFDLFNAKVREVEAEKRSIDATRDYWVGRAELERAVGGSLSERPSRSNGKEISTRQRLPKNQVTERR